MASSKTKDDASPASRKGSSLVPRNVTIGKRRTSMRFEPYLWDSLEEISRRENLEINMICTLVAYKANLVRTKPDEGDPLDAILKDRDAIISEGGKGGLFSNFEGTLTSAIRLFILAYFRRLANRDGFQANGGSGRPLAWKMDDLLDEIAPADRKIKSADAKGGSESIQGASPVLVPPV